MVAVEGLRGAPGARTASILAAYACQPHTDLRTEMRPPTQGAPGRGPAAASVERFSAARRLEGWAVWLQVTEAARLVGFWSEHPFDEADPVAGDTSPGAEGYVNAVEAADPALYERLVRELNGRQSRTPREVDTAEMADEFAAAEFALASGVTRPAADARVLAARVLVLDASLPRVAALARAGFLDWAKLSLLVHELSPLRPALAAAIGAALIPDEDLAVASASGLLDVLADHARPGQQLPAVTRLSAGRLKAAISGWMSSLDPEGAAERAAEARAQRRVWTSTDADGMGRLEASAGQEDIAAAWNALTDAARWARHHGDKRTLDQLRLDELIRRVTGSAQQTSPRQTSPQPPAGRPTAAQPGANQPQEPSTPDRKLSVSLLMPLSTYLGLLDDPATLDGYGTIPGALARRIAADAARDHAGTTTWRCVITDEGHRTVLGLTHLVPTPTTLPGPTRTSPAGGAPPGRIPRRVPDPGPLSTSRHDPPPRLVELVRTALPRCVFPGCGMPARRCDLDHRVPFDHRDPAAGGPTCSCNLQPTCRTHHRLKTTGLLAVVPPDDAGSEEGPALQTLGTLRWTSRAGLRYVSRSEPVVQPGGGEQAEALRGALRDLRRPDADFLRRAREAYYRAQAGAGHVASPGLLEKATELLETWTDTIERLDPDADPPLWLPT